MNAMRTRTKVPIVFAALKLRCWKRNVVRARNREEVVRCIVVLCCEEDVVVVNRRRGQGILDTVLTTPDAGIGD